jgi:hypothetical protein
VKPIRDMSALEVAAFAAQHLRSLGVDVVLSGGTCVTLYSESQYVSGDADLVLRGHVSRAVLRAHLKRIGFEERGRTFAHPETAVALDFPQGPLAVGKQPVTHIRTVTLATGTLLALSPTDCVKDRLAAYYHWGDRQCLEQAVLVAGTAPVDLADIR